MINVILQPLGLEFVNINVCAKVYQSIPNGVRVMGIFRSLSGNTQLHKLNRDSLLHKMYQGNYSSHSESQPSVSLLVDFLWVIK